MNDDFYLLDLNTRKLCSYAVLKDEKAKMDLYNYFESLSNSEKDDFLDKSEDYYHLFSKGAKKYKISKNAIYAAIRIKKELNISCYPYIEKIATKGWSRSDGTFSWGIRILNANYLNEELYSFDPVKQVLSKKYKLEVGPYLRNFLLLSTEKID